MAQLQSEVSCTLLLINGVALFAVRLQLGNVPSKAVTVTETVLVIVLVVGRMVLGSWKLTVSV